MREIEVKIKVESFAAVEQELARRGISLSEPIHQHATNYSLGDDMSPWSASQSGDKVVRIRKSNDQYEFNIKHQRTSELDNTEYETLVTDPVALDNILRTMDWTPKVSVEKVRRTAHIDEYELCLDDVKDLGKYIEIEMLASDDTEPKSIQEKLLAVLKSLGADCSHIEELSYDTLIYRKTNGLN